MCWPGPTLLPYCCPIAALQVVGYAALCMIWMAPSLQFDSTHALPDTHRYQTTYGSITQQSVGYWEGVTFQQQFATAFAVSLLATPPAPPAVRATLTHAALY